MIWFTSDLHFCHNKEFLYKPRGFNSVWDMNAAIVENWNKVVCPDDTVYLLGDVMLNDNEEGLRLLKQLKGEIHIVYGNHDTVERQYRYELCWNVTSVEIAKTLKYESDDGHTYRFYLSHYPTVTDSNYGDKPLHKRLINLFGHTHQQNNFYADNPYMYHVGVDSHNCTPVDIETVIADIKRLWRNWQTRQI